MYFDELDLNDNVLDALYDMRFDTCTPVQEKCIPEILEGHDAEVARAFGAKGIGLTRTEHMFFDDQKIVAMREMAEKRACISGATSLTSYTAMSRGRMRFRRSKCRSACRIMRRARCRLNLIRRNTFFFNVEC